MAPNVLEDRVEDEAADAPPPHGFVGGHAPQPPGRSLLGTPRRRFPPHAGHTEDSAVFDRRVVAGVCVVVARQADFVQ